MARLAHWLAFGIAGVVLATPAFAAWTGKPVNDGHGRTYFLMQAKAGDGTAELFCGAGGTVNFSLIWPDRNHGDAADNGAPVDMMLMIGAGTRFEAESYYWASGKGRLILDYGNPAEVRDIAEALKAPDASLTVSVSDSVNGIEKTVVFDAEGAAEAATYFLAWCPAAQ